MQRRPLLALVASLAIAVGIAAAPSAAVAAPAWAPAGHRHHPPRRADPHRRRAVHRQLRLHRRRRHLPRPGRPLLGHRRPPPRSTAAPRARCPSARPWRSPARPARHPGLQLLARHAGRRRDRPGRLRLQRLRPRPPRPRRRRPRSTRRPALGRPDRRQHRRHASRRRRATATATPACARASRCSQPEARHQPSAPTAAAGPTPSTPSPPASPVTRAAPSSTADGRALGVLSTLGVGLPGGVVNNVSDLSRGSDYLHAHGTGPVASAQLVLGTEVFDGERSSPPTPWVVTGLRLLRPRRRSQGSPRACRSFTAVAVAGPKVAFLRPSGTAPPRAPPCRRSRRPRPGRGRAAWPVLRPKILAFISGVSAG